MRSDFVGWDERTGIGFDNPDCGQNKLTYQMLAIGAWKHFADVLDRLGESAQAAKYRNLATAKTATLLAGPGGRDQSIDAFDLETLNRIAPTVRVNNMGGGVYVTFAYDRSIRLRCNDIRGDNAVINAVFLDGGQQL